jgi:hypothetical protein
MSACCNAASKQNTPTLVRRVRRFSSWVLPSVILVMVPKCPVCLAAYVAIFTGVSLSLATATCLRWAILLVGVVSLLYLIVQRLHSIGMIFKFTYLKKETEQCNTKQ